MTESVSVRVARVPVGALEDLGLALEPARVCVRDVVLRRLEHVEDEPAAGQKQLAGGLERLDALGVVGHVQVRAEGADDERDTFLDGRFAQVAEP